MGMKLLIVEDAPDIAEVVAFAVTMNWPACFVTIAPDGANALKRFEESAYDLVIIDVSVPPPDGFEVCRQIRKASHVPILMLTASSGTMDKVRALDLGADDYVTKPFDHLELLARLRSLMRRAAEHTVHGDTVLAEGDVSLDAAMKTARVKGIEVKLTATECRLLETLVRNAGMTVSHRTLMEQVWGPEYVHDTHYLKVFVRRLRQKLGDDLENPHYIRTEWGTGYRFLGSR